MQAVFLIVISASFCGAAIGAPDALHTVRAVHRLTSTEASQSLPVALTGTVTGVMPEWNGFAFQDNTDAIYVQSSLPMVRALRPGQVVRVSGYSKPGNFATLVNATAVDVVGKGALPSPAPADWKMLSSGACDNDFVSVTGVVRSAGFAQTSPWQWRSFALRIDLGGNMIWAYLRDWGALMPDSLVNSDVRVEGVCLVLANSRRQFERNALLLPSWRNVKVLRPSPEGLFEAPRRPIDKLFGFTSDVKTLHRVMLEGVITWVSPYRATVQSGQAAILLQSSSPLNVRVGDRIDAVGFPTAGTYSTLLDDAVIRVKSSGASVDPMETSAAAVLAAGAGEGHASPDALLLRLHGTLIEQSRPAHEQVLLMQDGKSTFTARLSEARSKLQHASLRVGSQLAVTGICSVQVDDQGVPHSFELLLRAPSDIQLLASPTWLNVTVAVRAALGMAAVLMLSGVWVIFLRRRLNNQTRMLRMQFAREAKLEKRFRELVDNASDMVYIRDLDGRFLHVNRGAEQITGYSSKELLSMNILELVVPEDREHNCSPMVAPHGDADLPTLECRILTKDGRELTLEMKRRVFREEDGTARIECIGRDITARRRALNDNLERFHTLADNIAQLAWIADRTGFVFWFNQRWFEYTGLTLEQSRGWQWEGVHHPDHLQRVLTHLRHCFAEGKAWDDTFPLRGADGEYRWFLGRAVPIRDRNGEVLRWFGTHTDITEQKQIEGELQRSNQDLQQFAYVASHDLQEPLRNISIFADLLHRSFTNGDLTPQRQQYIDVVTTGARRMERLITDLLDYSRVAAGPSSSNRSIVDTQSVVKEALANLEAALRESGAVVTYTNLPALEANPSQMQQVFQNLIANSLKYRRPEVPPRIHISATKRRDDWLFSIRDNGKGFDPMFNEKVFGIFKRLHGSDVPGTGIGLAICKTVIETHGGHIWAEGVPGEGATFYFSLPAARAVAV